MTVPPNPAEQPAPSPSADAPSAELVSLARALGIATEFTDWKNRPKQVSAATLTAVLQALEIDVDHPEVALGELRDREWQRLVPSCTVLVDGERPEIAVHVPAGSPVQVWVELEHGGRLELEQVENHDDDREVAGRMMGRAAFRMPAELPLGYHTLVADNVGSTQQGAVIVTPAYLGFPASMGNERIWGLATQLYSVRSEHSWGIGDLCDLRDLSVWSAGEHGADYVLVNPMHAGEPETPMEPSPYLPTSRRFFNPIYLRVEQIEEYASLPAGVQARVRALATEVHEKLDTVDAIDRDTAWSFKEQGLRLVHRAGLSAGRAFAFASYRRREGQGLVDFATWCVLRQALGTDWRSWPEEYRHPHTEQVRRFREENADEIDFFTWLQWCLDEQFARAQTAATDAGMRLGIVHDLAVGVSPLGADAWGLGTAFAHGVHVGAPPDQFTQKGQDWGQPPLRPDRLVELAYQPFRDMLAGILRHAGGVRVDHIIGLFRLWWVPVGMSATEGTYVRYDHDAMIGILALEAHRAGALVVGEDLGTVEPWVRKYLSGRGILGTSILWFEQDYEVEGGRPLEPGEWRELCLASVTTHDLPPTAGYLAGDHVRLRHDLGLLTDSLEDELKHAHDEQQQWLEVLQQQGLLQPGASVPEIVEALHRFLGKTPSRMLNLALTDAVGDRRTQNQPGTSNEYPNWRVPLSDAEGNPMLLEDVFTSPRADHLCTVMDEITRPGTWD